MDKMFYKLKINDRWSRISFLVNHGKSAENLYALQLLIHRS